MIVIFLQKRKHFILGQSDKIRGTELVLLPRNPQFIRDIDPFEPVYIPKQTILEDALKREAEKICFKDSQINKVVYDCDDASVYTKVT